MKIKQQWVHYTEWEDWHAGMWGKSTDESHLKTAIEFTSQWELYGAAMGEVIEAWPRTMLNTLTNVSVNRRAFLGHCAVCYKFRIPEYITRQAWKHLTNQQRSDADAIAEKHIRAYERKNIELHKSLGAPVLQ